MSLSGKFSSMLNKASDRLENALHNHSSAPPVPHASKPPPQGQSHPGQSYPGQYPGQSYPGQSYQGQPHPSQSYPGQAHPGQSYPPQSHPPNSSPQQPYWRPDTNSISASFKHELGAHGWGNAEAQNYTDSEGNSFTSPQGIHIRALASSSNPQADQKFTSARLSSHQTLARDRGVLSARITGPVAKGIWPAFWLLPADPFVWPTDGEVDIFEAWDGVATNHSCLHWGFFDGNDWDKHRVIETGLGDRILAQGETRRAPKFQHQGAAERVGWQPGGMGTGDGVLFEFAWDDTPGKGRLVWYIDGQPVMKAAKPAGTRPMRDFRIIMNVAMGGNVCKGRLPDDGSYEMVVRDLGMYDSRAGGWEQSGLARD
ncbi:hypothetical protein ANO11243_076920 [Dothideomycetidae sp. 11243]|nr:hypothetical protein ANO11243_076920 [fungal sp. No.11243]